MSKPVSSVVFDLDNTLINTEKIKEYFYEMAVVHGYSLYIAKEIYVESRTKGGKVIMSFDQYIKVLRQWLARDGREFKDKEIEEIKGKIYSGVDLLIPGAVELLDFCKNKGLKIYLLSLGVPTWQHDKFKMAGLDKYFDEGSEVVYTDMVGEGKVEAIKRIFNQGLDGEEIVLFNDKPDETEYILSVINLRAFLRKDSKDDRYTEGDYVDLQSRYSDRLTWSDDLKVLKEEFTKLF